MHRKELIQELISVAAPIFINDVLRYLSEGKAPTEDEIMKEIIAECEVIQSNVKLSDSAEISETRYAGPFGDLTATLCDIIDDLARDIKDQIRQELMMTIHTELSLAKADLTSAKKIESANTSTNNVYGTENIPAGGLPQFTVTEDVPLDEIKTGFDSIKQYDVLKGNALFAMIQKTIDRSAAGLSSHSAEDLNAARANRSDADTRDLIALAEEKYVEDMSKPFVSGTPADIGYTQIDDDVSANDALWDKMFADKYGAK
jgi:hypothetical protein